MQSDLPVEELVLHLLKTKLPANYYYHNYAHTQYVMEKVAEIAAHEQCTPKEKQLLHLAALWHDTGYINTYNGHEEESCRLAKRYLPQYGVTAADIETICSMIMATKVPQQPHNKLEEMIADADLEYLGAGGAAEKATALFKELQSLQPALTKEEWNSKQIAFLQQHHYFTRYCRQTKEPQKQAYLASLQ
ncbi:MAG: HD domain-containing protein [Bacteroidetes bacterium]|nr:HD domain-containing protein [Bacteroidota bacterium]